jgi:hypothetical protein
MGGERAVQLVREGLMFELTSDAVTRTVGTIVDVLLGVARFVLGILRALLGLLMLVLGAVLWAVIAILRAIL